MKKGLAIFFNLALSISLVNAQDVCPSADEISNILTSIGRNAISQHVVNNLKISIKEIHFSPLPMHVRQERHRNGDTMCLYYHKKFSHPLFIINVGKEDNKNPIQKINNRLK